MTGRSIGQIPDCCWRNNYVNEAYTKKPTQRQKQKQKLHPAGGTTCFTTLGSVDTLLIVLPASGVIYFLLLSHRMVIKELIFSSLALDGQVIC